MNWCYNKEKGTTAHKGLTDKRMSIEMPPSTGQSFRGGFSML